MIFSLELLRNRLREPLPGLAAHQAVMSYVREQAIDVRTRRSDYREGAVLMLIYPHNDRWHTNLIVRPAYEGVHSGQVAFPGGRREPTDPDLVTTALREAHEEVGILPTDVEVVGELSEIYIPPSNFLVKPFVGISASRPDFVLEPREVADILEPPVQLFLEADAIQKRRVQLSTGINLQVDCFEVDDHVVWGATAMMLAEFRAIFDTAQR